MRAGEWLSDMNACHDAASGLQKRLRRCDGGVALNAGVAGVTSHPGNRRRAQGGGGVVESVSVVCRGGATGVPLPRLTPFSMLREV